MHITCFAGAAGKMTNDEANGQLSSGAVRYLFAVPVPPIDQGLGWPLCDSLRLSLFTN